MVANGAALLSRKLPLPEWPIDFGLEWKGRRLLGNHKTWRGLVVAVVVASLVGLIQGRLMMGLLLGIGGMMGDLIGAVMKRRSGLEPGEKHFWYDRVLDAVVALNLVWGIGYLDITFWQCIWLVAVSAKINDVANVVWYRLRIKESPW